MRVCVCECEGVYVCMCVCVYVWMCGCVYLCNACTRAYASVCMLYKENFSEGKVMGSKYGACILDIDVYSTLNK